MRQIGKESQVALLTATRISLRLWDGRASHQHPEIAEEWRQEGFRMFDRRFVTLPRRSGGDSGPARRDSRSAAEDVQYGPAKPAAWAA